MDPWAADEQAAAVAEHLERRHRVRVARASRLDTGVFRVDLEDSSPWVARVFPPSRPREAVEGDAAILRLLENAGFPAERCAAPDPLTELDGERVLVTTFVEGERTGDGRAFAALATLLGRLHAATATARPGAEARPGGAWHHVATDGGLVAELDATAALLRDLEQRLPPRDRARSAGLRRQLQEIDLDGLPEALLHPDFVPANVLRAPDGRHVLVDWTGAGRGPRIWSLGFLLYATAGRSRLVQLVASRYARHVTLTEDELDRLPEAIIERELVFGAWAAAHRGRALAQIEAEAAEARRLARRIAAQARDALRTDPAAPAATVLPRAPAPPRMDPVPPPAPHDKLPLSALLSRAWVAWTIELDNAYEAVAPRRTTRGQGGRGPWLISSVMWWTCLRHLSAARGPLTAGRLATRSRLDTNLNGLERWGYIRIQRPRTDHATWVLTLTPAGLRAAETFARLPAEVDGRWQQRFSETARLREVLLEAVTGLDPALPDCLPITGPANAFLAPMPAGPAPQPARDLRVLPIGALLARVLVAYTLEAESGTRGGLPFREDLLCLLDERGVQVRELPLRSGVSREAQDMALGVLCRAGLGEVIPDPDGSRFKVARLSPRGVRARDAHREWLRHLDGSWAARAPGLREVLAALIEGGRLTEGLEPPPGSWRAGRARPHVLPYYPMVSHRGGYPDGS